MASFFDVPLVTDGGHSTPPFRPGLFGWLRWRVGWLLGNRCGCGGTWRFINTVCCCYGHNEQCDRCSAIIYVSDY